MKETRITFENEHGEYAVTVRSVEMTLTGVMERLVCPILLAAGYHPRDVEAYSSQVPEEE